MGILLLIEVPSPQLDYLTHVHAHSARNLLASRVTRGVVGGGPRVWLPEIGRISDRRQRFGSEARGIVLRDTGIRCKNGTRKALDGWEIHISHHNCDVHAESIVCPK